MPEVTLNGARIYYEDHGGGFPLVLSHGLGGDSSMWMSQVPVFKDRYRLVIWDCRGHGQSEITQDGYSIGQFVEDKYALMKHLGIEKAHIGGLSMGGWISWLFALTHPEAVASLVLSDSAGILQGISEEDLANKRLLFEAGAAIAEKEGRAPLVDETVRLMFAEEFVNGGSEMLELVKKRISEDRGIGYARTIKRIFPNYWETPKGDVLERLGSISAPALVIVGELDLLTPVATQQALHQAIPGSRLEIIPGSGHVPPIEKPEKWNKLVLEFLNGKEK